MINCLMFKSDTYLSEMWNVLSGRRVVYASDGMGFEGGRDVKPPLLVSSVPVQDIKNYTIGSGLYSLRDVGAIGRAVLHLCP